MKKLLIIGAGNFPPEVEEIARLNGYDDFAFIDDNKDARCQPVIGDLASIKEHIANYSDAIVAFGNNEIRLRYTKELQEIGYNIPILIHPTAYISPDAILDPGCIIRTYCVVSRYVKLGTATILNVGSLIDHDCDIGEGSHILMGAVVRNMVKLPPMSRVEPNVVVE